MRNNFPSDVWLLRTKEGGGVDETAEIREDKIKGEDRKSGWEGGAKEREGRGKEGVEDLKRDMIRKKRR